MFLLSTEPIRPTKQISPSVRNCSGPAVQKNAKWQAQLSSKTKQNRERAKQRKRTLYPMTAAMAKVMPGARLVVALAMDGEARWRP